MLAVYQSFPTADRDLAIAIGNDPMWGRFCDVIGLEELAADDELASNAGRRANRERLVARVSEKLSSRTASEWQKVLGEAGIPCSLVQRLSEVVEDPQVAFRRSLLPVPDTNETMHTVHSPFRLASIQEPRNARFPELGAHTREVLAEHGFADSDVDALVAGGAVQEGTGVRVSG